MQIRIFPTDVWNLICARIACIERKRATYDVQYRSLQALACTDRLLNRLATTHMRRMERMLWAKYRRQCTRSPPTTLGQMIGPMSFNIVPCTCL